MQWFLTPFLPILKEILRGWVKTAYWIFHLSEVQRLDFPVELISFKPQIFELADLRWQEDILKFRKLWFLQWAFLGRFTFSCMSGKRVFKESIRFCVKLLLCRTQADSLAYTSSAPPALSEYSGLAWKKSNLGERRWCGTIFQWRRLLIYQKGKIRNLLKMHLLSDMHVTVSLWRSEDHFWTLVPFFHYVVPRVWTQVLRLGGQSGLLPVEPSFRDLLL